MQIEYKKEWLDTYLWVQPDHAVEETYVEKMLLHNPGEGRLEFSRQQRDGEEYFCYKITGKKALNSIYAVVPIGERQIRGILKQLFTTLENGKEYLLSEEDFVLAPNYIFATFPQMELEFCYVPGYGVPLREQLEGLFEYLLNRVDYEDKKAVNLLYDCYMFCMKEKGGLAEIKKLVAQEKEEVPVTVPPLPPTPAEPASDMTRVSVPKKTVRYPEPEESLTKKNSSISYVSWLTEHLFPWKKREPVLVAEKPEEYCAEPSGKGLEEGKVPVTGMEAEDTERTVLLSVRKKPEVPELVCEQTGEVIPLTKFPFYLGSAAEYADFVSAGEGVSRIHCCISKKGDNYYLSDLNSTNGTYLNKQEVGPGKDVLLSANDEIRVGGFDFYVKFPCH